MNETFKKFTSEIAAEIIKHFQTKEMQDFITATKAAEDSGSFEVVISTADLDRQGESIDQNGWVLDSYRLNPVVLWAHDYFSLPIGIADEIETKDGKLIAKGRFAPAEANPLAQQIRRLYDLKIVRATSVGFIPLEYNGGNILKAELLEFSFVPVPANPFALSLSKAAELGLNTQMLALKGIEFKQDEDEPKEGDPCTLDDGSEGELKPDADGNLVCMPKETTKPEETEESIRIPVKDADNYDPDSIRTIAISEEEGIQALTACPKGEYEGGTCGVGVEIITYIFDKEKWTIEEAQAWIDEHSKAKKRSKKDVEKVGAELAALQSEVDDAVVRHSRAIIEIVQSEYGEGEEEGGEGSEEERSIEKEVKSLFEAVRKIQLKPDEKQRIKNAIKTEIAALEKTLKGDEGEEHHDGDIPKQRSKGAGSDFEAWLQQRQVLRLVNNITSKALEKLNERARKK